MIRPPPPSPLFPYTTLFRSHRDQRGAPRGGAGEALRGRAARRGACDLLPARRRREHPGRRVVMGLALGTAADRKSTRLNSSHVEISYAVFCLKKKKNIKQIA